MGVVLSGKKCDKARQDTMETISTIYHEKQSRELCALHALNSLFQDGKAFSKKELDSICQRLSPETYINPHRSVLGLGNYDVNVIMAALETKGKDTIWFDKRKDSFHLQLQKIDGFILNIPTDLHWGIIHLPIHRKHWICVRSIGGTYYNFDSKLDRPEKIGNEIEVKNYLSQQIDNKEKELLLVVEQSVAQSGAWYHCGNRCREIISEEHCSKSEVSLQNTASDKSDDLYSNHTEKTSNGSSLVTADQNK